MTSTSDLSSQEASTELKINERRARWTWTFIILGLLGSQLSIGVVAVVLAHQGDSKQIIPNYYQRALAWDDSMAAQRESDKLGWRAELQVSEALDAQGERPITIVLRQHDGSPVLGAQGTLRIYHNKFINQAMDLPVSELSSGVYRTTAPMHQKGVWQFALRMQQGDSAPFIHEREWDLTEERSHGDNP